MYFSNLLSAKSRLISRFFHRVTGRPGTPLCLAFAVLACLAMVSSVVADDESSPLTNAIPVITAPGNKAFKQGESITAFGIAVSDADGDPVNVTVTGLPQGLSYTGGQVQGTVATGAAAQAYTVTVRADDGVNAAVTVTFSITVSEAQAPNVPPVVTTPGDKTYEQGETITAFGIAVSDADGDPVNVTVTGLPQGLSYTGGQVQGTVATGAAAQAYTVTVRADDGVNAAVTVTFSITVSEAQAPNVPPVVTAPGDKTYEQGETITAFGIAVSDADGDRVNVTVTGLPQGLSYTGGQVQGTVATGAAAQAYAVSVTAGDGVNAAVTVTFSITVTAADTATAVDTVSPTVSIKGPKRLQPGGFWLTIVFSEAVTGFEQSDVTVGNGSVVKFAHEPAGYRVKIRAATSGTVTVDVAANVAADAAGNGNSAASRFSVESDPERPAVTITGPAAAQTGPFDVHLTFSESVTGFDQSDVAVSNGSVTAFSGTGASYMATITPTASGTVTVKVAAHVASDRAGNPNFPASHAQQATLNTPLVTEPGASNTAPVIANPGDKTYDLGETITAFGIAVSDADGDRVNVTVIGLPQGLSYTGGQVQGTVATGAAAQAYAVSVTAGDGVNAAVTVTFSITVTAADTATAVDTVSPTVSIKGPKRLQPGGFWLTIVFSEAVTGFEQSDVTVGNGSVVKFAHEPAGYRVKIRAATSGTVTVDVAANVAADAAGNGNSAASRFSVESDPERPAVTITGPAAAQTGPFDVHLTFSESVTGFDQSDVAVSNGSVTAFSGTGASYTATITPTASGTVTVKVAAHVASDRAGNPNFPASHAQQATLNTPLVTEPGASNTVPVIANPGDMTYGLGETIAAFDITVTDADGDDVTVTVTGLPSDLSYANGQVQGTVSADLAPGDHTVTIAADDGGNVVATETFTITVTAGQARSTVKDSTQGRPTVTITDASAAEGDSLAFTVRLSWAVPGGLTVTPSFTDVTATKGTDYTENAAALTFVGISGETKRFTVLTTDDSDEETSETFTVGLAVSGTPVKVAASDTATGTITDNDDDEQPTLFIHDVSASEGDALTFTVTLDDEVSGGLTVTPGFAGGTAAKGTDYTASTEALGFQGDQGETQSFTVATTEDTVVESNETFTVSLTVSKTSETVTATDTATGTITNDDTATVTVTDIEFTEGVSAGRVTATLDNPVQGGLKVNPVSPNSGDATRGKDYITGHFTFIFNGNAGEQSSCACWTIVDDDIVEGTETFEIHLEPGPGGVPDGVTLAGPATGTIQDNDTATVTIGDASATEGDAITFTVIVDKAVQGGFTVTPSYANGTAQSGTDYTENTTAITFAGTVGETQTFTVQTTADTISVSDKTFTVGLSVSGSAGTVTADDFATGTITDADSTPTVQIADATAIEGGQMTFTVTLDKEAGSFTVTPSFTDVTATEGTDYTANTAALTFLGNKGETQTFMVQTAADTVEESPETFTVGLTASDTSVETNDTATGTIFEDRSPPTLTIEDASADEGGDITFTVTLDKATDHVVPGKTFSLVVEYTDVTATNGADYTREEESPPGGLYFAGMAGETQTFTVPTTADSVVESAETFTVGLKIDGPPFAWDVITATDTATGTIRDDSDPAAVTIEDASATEGNAITFTATVDKAVPGGFTMTPGFTDGTARSGVDYTVNTAAITFAGTAGEQQTFTVATLEDAFAEANETFTVGLTVSGTSVNATDTATGTINDDGDTGTNSPPEILALNFRYYDFQYQTIIPWCIKVDDDDGDDVTVTVTGLPPGLSYSDSGSCPGGTGRVNERGTVSGTAMPDSHRIPALRDNAFTVTITADDGVNAVVRHRFSYFVMWGRPHITSPGNKTFQQGEEIAAFDITVDADEKYKEVTLTGLPEGLSYDDESEQVTGTVAATAAIKDYTVTITADGDGPGWLSPVTETFTITVISTRPGVGITGPSDKQNGAFDAAIEFTEPVTGFAQTDLTVGNGAATALSGSGASYTATITPSASGTVTVDVPANVAEDAAGNRNTAASQYTVEADLVAPTVSITGPTASQSDAFDVTITFSEPVTGFAQADVTVGNGAATALSGSGASYTATITPTATGTLTVDVAADVAQDEAGNGNTAADQFTVQVELVQPTVVISCPADTQMGAFDADIDFSEAVTGFEQGEVTVDSGTVTAPSGSGASYTVTITPTTTGTLTLGVAANVAVAVDAPGHGNLAAQSCTVQVDLDDPQLSISDASASEGDAMTFVVTLDKAVSGGFQVTPDYTDGTAKEGSDYTKNEAALTFEGTAGEKQSFTVATKEDRIEEPDETFDVELKVSGTSAAVTDTDTATGTITDDDGSRDPMVTISEEVVVEGKTLKFEMKLNRAVTDGFAVTPTFTDGTATKSDDYVEKTDPIKFDGRAGEKKTLEVPTTDDSDAEPDEVFEVSVSISGTKTTVTVGEGKGIIVDDDHAATVTIDDVVAGEGDSLTFTVTVDKAVGDDFTVTPGFTGGTATEGTDYTGNTAVIEFDGTTSGETHTFTVSTSQDADVEADETFIVNLTITGTTETLRATDTATGTIVDDDEASLTIADASASEGDSITFTVTLDKAVAGGLTVTPSFTDGTATEGTDYTGNTSALTFAGTAGETQSFTVATTDDADEEEDETFTVSLTISGTSATIRDTATGTITDDDSQRSRNPPALTIADAEAGEGDQITFTVTLDKPVSGGLTVTPSFTDGTATEGTDFTENTAALTFAGTTGERQSFSVATTEDTETESDETFTVSLAVSGNSEKVTATDTATGKILDDETPAVTIADAEASEGDQITFTVTLGKAVTGGLTVTPSFTDGTATDGTDYTENTAALSFKGTTGETQTFSVVTTEDTEAEPDETFTVSLAVSGTSETVRASDTATGTITDDHLALPAVTITNASAAEGDQMTFTVRLDKVVQSGFTVTPDFIDGSAQDGTDYTANTAALNFAGTAGEEQILTVATLDDEVLEADERFTVSLKVSNAAVTVGNPATGTITDDDDGGSGNGATVTIADASAAEGDAMTFTVTLRRAVSGGLTVTPEFTDGSAQDGTDYTANTKPLRFSGALGEQHTLTVATLEDAVAEAVEGFTVSLTVSNAPAGATVGDPATGTITDDDDGSGNGATVTIADASAAEGNEIAFTVTLHRAVEDGLTVTPGFTDGSAQDGTDYTANAKPLHFSGALGEQHTLTVATLQDAVAEAVEGFTVSLTVSNAPAGATVGDPATGTITDDDAAAVTIADVSAGEGETMTFTVTLDNAVPGGFTVTPSFTDATATQGTDYTANTAALSFSGTAGEMQTFTVATLEDAFAETDETFTVVLSVSGTQATVTATDPATGTITDDDAAAVTIADASASEGETMTFTVELDKAVPEGFTVTPSFTDATATQGTDYTANAATLSFSGTAGETQTFTVATLEDAFAEADETFTVVLSVSGTQAAVTTADPATGTITDDDAAAVTIADASASEGETMTFTVTLRKTVPGGLTVTPSFTDATATQGTDYTGNAAALSFAGTAGETQTFTVAALEDAVAEDDETFTVSLNVSDTPSEVTVGAPATGTIQNTTVAVRVTGAIVTGDDNSTLPTTVEESAAPTTMIARASRHGDMLEELTVRVKIEDGTATAGVDYARVADLEITIPKGQTSATETFTLTPINDTVVEGNETITLNASVPGYPVEPGTVTILDDDIPAFSLAVQPARLGETDGATPLAVTATTGNVTFPDAVTIAVRVGGGTASEGADYAEVADFDITIPAGLTSATETFILTPVEDALVEGDETIDVGGTLHDYSYAVTTAKVTLIEDTTARQRIDRVNLEVLPHVARGLMDSGISAINECAVSGRAPRASLTALVDAYGEAFETGRTSLEQVMGGADFSLPLRAAQQEAQAPSLFNTVWGCGDYRTLSDRQDGGIDWDGSIFSLHVGLDLQPKRNLVTGLAVSHSLARFDYQDMTAMGSFGGRHNSRMTSVSPYLRWTLSQSQSLWATVGMGWGSVRIEDEALASETSGAGMRMAAVGLDSELFSWAYAATGNLTSVKLKAEGSLGRLDVDGSPGMSALTVDVNRLRLALEGSHTYRIGTSGTFTPALQVGWRHDGGDGATGSGMEIGGSLRYLNAVAGITVEGSGLMLVAHAGEYEEWSLGGLIRFDPGARGRGLSVSVRPTWGPAASGVEQYLDAGVVDPALPVDAAGRVEAEIGYGVSALGDRLLTPYSGLLMADDGSRDYRVGSRLQLDGPVALSLEVGRREAAGRADDHRVMLQLQVRP